MRLQLHRWAAATISALLVAGCGSSEPSSPATSNNLPNPIEIASEVSTEAPPPPPPARFDQEEGGTYYYVAAVSEEDQKKGKAAGSVIGFRYLGKNGKGEHVLLQIANDGSALGKSYCSEPCKVIRDSSGRIGFNSQSIIGAAFEDAINGNLKPYSPSTSASAENVEASSSQAELSLWTGRFVGAFEGGADGDLTVSAGRNGRLGVALSIGSTGCAGDISGSSLLNGEQLLVTKARDPSGNQCRLNLFRRGDRIDISEDGCSYFHGASCSFNGQVRRR